MLSIAKMVLAYFSIEVQEKLLNHIEKLIVFKDIIAVSLLHSYEYYEKVKLSFQNVNLCSDNFWNLCGKKTSQNFQ